MECALFKHNHIKCCAMYIKILYFCCMKTLRCYISFSSGI